MKSIIPTLISAAALAPGTAFALFPLLDHIDIDPRYHASSNTWTWALVTDFEEADPADAYFPARDATYPDGERDYRPPGEPWDFFGVEEGEPLWIYPEGSSGYAWPGFADTPAGLKDPMRFSLVDVDGPAGGVFSLYRVIGGSPVVFMSTADGIGATDFYEKPQGHHHLSWAFSRKGLWAVKLRVSAVRTAGNAPTLAGPTDSTLLFFAIGERAAWRASRFPAETVMDEAISGPAADPDHDGWSNLLEYAFGGNPTVSGLVNNAAGGNATPVQVSVVSGGVAYQGISFSRRRDLQRAEVEYTVEWQSGLDAGGWEAGGIEHEVQPIDETWERVIIRDTAPYGAGPRFARVRVAGLD